VEPKFKRGGIKSWSRQEYDRGSERNKMRGVNGTTGRKERSRKLPTSDKVPVDLPKYTG